MIREDKDKIINTKDKENNIKESELEAVTGGVKSETIPQQRGLGINVDPDNDPYFKDCKAKY